MSLTLTLGDVLAIVGLMTGPVAIVLIWAIRLEGRVNGMHEVRKADLLLLEERRQADKTLHTTHLEQIKESLEEIKVGLAGVGEMQRTVDHLAVRLGVVPTTGKT